MPFASHEGGGWPRPVRALVLARAVNQLGAFEIYEPPSQALLAEMVAPERRPQAFGLLGAALAAAGVGAGILAVLVGGVSLRLLFVADSVTCVAAAALILMWVQEPSTTRQATSGGNPWRDGRLLVMPGAGTGFAFAWNLSVTALPLTVAARGLGPAETGWPLAVAAVVTIAACLDSPAVHRGARGLAHRRRPVRPAGRTRAVRWQGRDDG